MSPLFNRAIEVPMNNIPVGSSVSIQPAYDLLTGSASPPPVRQAFRQSHTIKPENTNQDLRAEIKSLQYELSTLKQERDVVALQHEKEIGDIQAKADTDFRQAQTLETERNNATRKYESLVKELREIRHVVAKEKTILDKQSRAAREQLQASEEDTEEARTALEAHERQSSQKIQDLQRRNDTLQHASEELLQELGDKYTSLRDAQEMLSQQELVIGNLENEILRLKAQVGDAETINAIKRELSEQVAHIKELESTNRKQLGELKHHRQNQKSIEIVEEQKLALESRLAMMDNLRKDFSEAQLQRQILEDERKSWTLYLQNEPVVGEMTFHSPEELARTLVDERLERAALTEKMGTLQLEVSERDELIKSFESEIDKLKAEMKMMRISGGGQKGSRSRLERQQALAFKEVEFLRAQLKMIDAEENTFRPGQLDEPKTQRIQELERLVDQYRAEIQSLNEQLDKKDDNGPSTDVISSNKRLREEEPDERLGVLSRKNRTLQDEIAKLHQSIAFLEKELEVAKAQVTSLRNTPRTRILELRHNPTAETAAIKASTLKLLQTENAALLAQLEGCHNTKVIPISSLESARQELRDMEQAVAEKEKRMTRLKQIWSAKSLEFREAVASVLGWKMDFMPNGRVRVTSMFKDNTDNDNNHKSQGKDIDDDDGDVDGENSIIFDGEKGTMKIAGGPQGAFARDIKTLVRFWVEERQDIPCFLAAMTLEFYERTTRAARI